MPVEEGKNDFPSFPPPFFASMSLARTPGKKYPLRYLSHLRGWRDAVQLLLVRVNFEVRIIDSITSKRREDAGID